MTLVQEITDLAQRIATEFKSTFTGETYTGDLDSSPFGYKSFVGTDVTNEPVGFTNGLVFTAKNEDDTGRVQFAYSTSGTYAVRWRLGGSWSSWQFFFAGHDTISDISGLQAALDAKLATPTSSLKTICHSNGGLGGSVATNITFTSIGFRWDVRLPVATTEWRIKFRNYDLPAGANKTALTGKQFGIGDHAVSNTATDYETGSFVSSPTILINSDFSIPNTNSWYTSPWFTGAGDQFAPNVNKLLFLTQQAAGSFSCQTGAGKSWYWTNLTSAPNSANAGSSGTVGYIPIDWIIEYKTNTSKDVYLWIGDSISEGIQGTKGTTGASLAPTSLYRAYPNLWAARNNVIVNNISLAGISAAYFGGTSTGLWTRCDHSGVTYKGVVIALGSNDMFSGQTLAQYRTNFLNMCATARSLFGSNVEIYAALIPPRNTLTSIPPANDWLSQFPGGINGVIDTNTCMRGTSVNTLAAEMTADTIHPSYQGTAGLVQAVTAGMPRSVYGL